METAVTAMAHIDTIRVGLKYTRRMLQEREHIFEAELRGFNDERLLQLNALAERFIPDLSSRTFGALLGEPDLKRFSCCESLQQSFDEAKKLTPKWPRLALLFQTEEHELYCHHVATKLSELREKLLEYFYAHRDSLDCLMFVRETQIEIMSLNERLRIVHSYQAALAERFETIDALQRLMSNQEVQRIVSPRLALCVGSYELGQTAPSARHDPIGPMIGWFQSIPQNLREWLS